MTNREAISSPLKTLSRIAETLKSKELSPGNLVGQAPGAVNRGGDLVGSAATTGANLVSNSSEVLGVGGAALGSGVAAVSTAAAAVEAIMEQRSRGKFKSAQKQLDKLLQDPVIKGCIEQREHNNIVLALHQNEIRAREAGLAPLEQQRALLEAQFGSQDPNVVALDQAIQHVQNGINGLKQHAQAISNEITEINKLRIIKDLRPLEAVADLGSEVAKHSGDNLINNIDIARRGLSTTLDLGQGALGIASAAGAGGAALANAVPIVGGVASVATGSMQAAVAGASLAHGAYQAYKNHKREQNAAEVRAEIDDPVLAAAIKRIETKAHRNKVQRGVEMLRDGALVVTGVSSAVAGSALVVSGALAAASAPGFGAGAAPGLAVAGVAAGVAVGAGAVSAAAAAGVEVFKVGRHVQSAMVKNECIRTIIGTQSLLAMGGGKLPSDRDGNPQKLRDPNIPSEVSDAILSMQRHAISKGMSPEDALDVAKLHEFATNRLIAHDTREAVAVLSQKMLQECHEAFVERGGVNIVSSDLPENTPAITAARKLGMTDREITSMVNAMASHSTRQAAQQTIAQRTGLRSGSDKKFGPQEGVVAKPKLSHH